LCFLFLPFHYIFHVLRSLKSRWLKSGDMGAEYYEPPRLIHWRGQQWSRYTFSSRPKRGGAPSCCKYRSNEMHWSIALCINNSCKRQFQWPDTSYTVDSRACQDVYWGWGWWSWTFAANSAIKALYKYRISF
jgi:hypothetical protein